MAYIYNADIYCDDCGKYIRGVIDEENNAPAEAHGECNYDSDEYPKYVDGSSEADSPQHCGSGDVCFNVIELPDGHKIGVWLENDLTSDGEDYVIESVREGGDVANLWSYYYEYIDFTRMVVCNGCGEDFDPAGHGDDDFCIDCLDKPC